MKALKWKEDDLIRVFGSDKGKRKNDTQKGEAVFFDAKQNIKDREDTGHAANHCDD